MVAGSDANARMNWVHEMAASIENDTNHSVPAREVTRTGLEVLARAFGISIVRRDHQRSRSFDDALRGERQDLKERLRKKMSKHEIAEQIGLRLRSVYDDVLAQPAPGREANVEWEAVRLTREGDVEIEFAPGDCVRQAARDFDEELAERLLSESMDRLAIVARDVSELAAETASDLALIETMRGQIDRAQAENWALLRELTQQAQ